VTRLVLLFFLGSPLNLTCLGPIALLIACIVGTPAHSGGCYSGASYSYGYGASYYPSYSYYSTPSYSYYTPSYTPTYYTPKYEVQEVVVPKAVRAYTSPDYFASVSDYYRDKVMLDAIAGKSTDASKLAQELAEIKQQLKGQAQSQNPQFQSSPQAQYQQPVYQPQVPMVPQSTYAPQQQQGYAPSGGTPCDWRAQQAYQQGLQTAQQQYAAQQPQQPPQQYGQQYAPQYGQQGQQPQQPYSQQYGPPNQQQGPAVNPYSQQGRQPIQQPQQQPQQSPTPQTRPDTTPPQELPSTFSQESNRGGGSSGNRPRPQPAPSAPPEGESRAPTDNGSVPDGLAAVVGENCLRCHGANNAEQGGSFDLRDLKSIPLEDRAESYTQVVSGEMPRKSNTLSKEHQLLFKDWYRAAVKARRARAAEATASNGRVASSN
jgi:hypothetical protein